MIDFSHQETGKLEKIVKKYADATGTFICCLDYSGTRIVDYSCTEAERAVLNEYVTDAMINNLFSRVALSNIEDQVIENTSVKELKVAATAIYVSGRCRLVYIICGVLGGGEIEDEKIKSLGKRVSMASFQNAVDAARDVTTQIMSSRMSAVKSDELSRQTKVFADDLSEALRRSTAMTGILRFLNSDKTLDFLMADYLDATSEFVSAKYAYTVRVNGDYMNVQSTYKSAGSDIVYSVGDEIKKFPFIDSQKPIIISYQQDLGELKQGKWLEIGVRSVICIPLTLKERTDFYLIYIETDGNRKWEINELQFLTDCGKILQSALERKVDKNSIVGSYCALEEVMEYVGCAIIVVSKEDKSVPFANQFMQERFGGDKMNPELRRIIYGDRIANGLIDFYDYSTGLYYEIQKNDVTWVDGSSVSMFALYDVTDKKNYQKRIEQQAFTDFLTGLFNRMCCERDLAKYIDEAKLSDGKGALLYLDLDDFKHINDGLGHQYGDVLLKNISKAMRSVPGLEETCYRMGGDEFVIIITPGKYGDFDRIISDIKQIFATPFFLKDGEYYCTMSMGVVAFPDEGDNVEDLVQKADLAMYEAKKTGKNRVSKYVSSDADESNKRLDMEKNMRKATTDDIGQFLVYYQPVMDIRGDKEKCIGAEALIRWDSKELGFISPADFIPLAEYLGLINPIGEHVLKEACVNLKRWNDNVDPDFHVSVNLSVVQLMQNDIVDRIEEIVRTTGVNPKNLTLEVTESLAINDMDRMKGIMTAIRAMGIQIALDDFGTGYSSLNHIREIPLDVIKVDQSFVRELANDDYSKSFIEMVSRLAGAIKVEICVEGAETAEQVDILKKMQIRMVQGYHFDKPLSKNEFVKKYMQP